MGLKPCFGDRELSKLDSIEYRKLYIIIPCKSVQSLKSVFYCLMLACPKD